MEGARRRFLKVSAGGVGTLLAAGAHAGAEPPLPGAAGRSHQDVAGRREALAFLRAFL